MEGAGGAADPREELCELAAAVRAYVEWQVDTGASGLPIDEAPEAVLARLAAGPVPSGRPPAAASRAAEPQRSAAPPARAAEPQRSAVPPAASAFAAPPAASAFSAPSGPPQAAPTQAAPTQAAPPIVRPPEPSPRVALAAPAAPPLQVAPAAPAAPPPHVAPAAPAAPPPRVAPAGPPLRAAAPAPAEAATDERRTRLALLAEEVRACTRCGLHEARNHTVFARGNPFSELCFVGEGPGADEDAQGEPFVGAAGKLLDRMIAAMGYQRDEVYICNIVKCRPPGNRKPEPAEMAACMPYLTQQLALMKPKVIVALGATAVQGMIGTSEGITRMRGKWKLYKGSIPIMPTFHPAYLLRNPDAKRDVWSDLQQVMQHLGKAPAGKA